MNTPNTGQAPDDIIARSWTKEDAHLENGNYMNECCHCHRTFWGHKRRVSCRECVEAAAPTGQAGKTLEEIYFEGVASIETHSIEETPMQRKAGLKAVAAAAV